MAFCGKCGTQVQDDVQLCPNCGQTIGEPAQPQQPPQQSPYPPQQQYGQQQYQQGYQQGGGNALSGFDVQPHKSSLGMDANIAVLVIFIAMVVLSWIPYGNWVAWAPPLVFFFMEKESGFVRVLAFQACVLGIVRSIVAIIVQIIIWAVTPRNMYSAVMWVMSGRAWRDSGTVIFFRTVSYIIAAFVSVIGIFLLIKAYGYKQVELPLIGPMAKKASQK